VNTAMLTHEGFLASGNKLLATTKKSGRLTKARKDLLLLLLQAVRQEKNKDTTDGGARAALLQELSNFNTLLALYNDGLEADDCERLCGLVRKWGRGQKKGTSLDDKLIVRLQSILEH
jgi:hypothetical protein